MDIERGLIVLVALTGDFGKPRLAVVVQSDALNDEHSTISVCLMTSALSDTRTFRVRVDPHDDNGLRLPSEIMVDKIMTLPRDKLRKSIGRVSAAVLAELNLALRWTLGLT